MHCIHCGHKQLDGHFCGMCGVQFTKNNAANQHTSTPALNNNQITPPNTNSSIQLEELKKNLQLYVQFFLRYLKNPSNIFAQKHLPYRNSLISILLFSFLVSLSLHQLAQELSYAAVNTSFFSLFGGFLIAILSLQAVGLLSVSLINHFFGPQYFIKELINLYGAHLSLLNILAFTSLLLFWMKSFSFGSSLFLILLLFSFFLLPLYLLNNLLTKKSIGIDRFYGYIVFLVTFVIILLILMSLFADSFVTAFLIHIIFH